MEPILSGKKNLYRVYLATLFFAFHYVLVVYINSSFLENAIGRYGKNIVGLLYVAGSALSIVFLSRAPHILRSVGNKTLMLMMTVGEIACLFLIAFSQSLPVIICAFIVHHAIIPVLFLNFDIFIQRFSKHEESGKARGTYLSLINICFVITPLISGLILEKTSFNSVYVISAIIILPLIYFISKIQNFVDSEYKDLNIFSSIKATYHNPDIKLIVIINFILQMFYAAMVIYMPIYLHDVIGFNLQDIGLIFTVMLMPFVIFELPLGKISDTLIGEKELLIVGMVIMAASTAVLPFINSKALIVWAAILFMTRVGASFVEIMAESYFFKKIENEDTGLLSLWRSVNSFSYMFIPLVISGLLFFVDLKFIFPIIGALCISGIFFARRINDTL